MEKRKMEKEGKNKSQHLGFLSRSYLATLNMYIKLEDSSSHKSREPVTEILNGEKEKWTNKGNDKQEEADSLLHKTTSHTQHLYQISKS